MAKQPTETSNGLQHRNSSVEDEEVDDTERAPATRLAETDVDAASHWIRDTSGAGSSNLQLETAATGAPGIDFSSLDQARDALVAEPRTPRQRSDAVSAARRVYASSSSRRSPSPLQTTSSPGIDLESIEVSYDNDPNDQSLQRRGGLAHNAPVSGHPDPHEAVTRPHQVSLPLAVLPGESHLQTVYSSQDDQLIHRKTLILVLGLLTCRHGSITVKRFPFTTILTLDILIPKKSLTRCFRAVERGDAG